MATWLNMSANNIFINYNMGDNEEFDFNEKVDAGIKKMVGKITTAIKEEIIGTYEEVLNVPFPQYSGDMTTLGAVLATQQYRGIKYDKDNHELRSFSAINIFNEILICQLQKIVNKYKYQNDYKKYSIQLLILLQECVKNIDIKSSSIDVFNFHGITYETQTYKDIETTYGNSFLNGFISKEIGNIYNLLKPLDGEGANFGFFDNEPLRKFNLFTGSISGPNSVFCKNPMSYEKKQNTPFLKRFLGCFCDFYEFLNKTFNTIEGSVLDNKIEKLETKIEKLETKTGELQRGLESVFRIASENQGGGKKQKTRRQKNKRE
jgi:hypothetical protein